MIDFAGKSAIVTGGASGIGLAIAEALLTEGARVAILDLRADHLATASKKLIADGHSGSFRCFEIDVSDRTAMHAIAADIVEHFGLPQILVNNAGVGIQRPWSEVTFADWDFGLEVNLGGVINGIMIFGPLLRASGGEGHIVNTASLAGLASVPPALAIYGVSKTAIVALTEALAPEFAQSNIGMSVLCPGLVRSNIQQIDRNRPPRFRSMVAAKEHTIEDSDRDNSTSWIEPAAAAELVLSGIRANALYIITHGDHRSSFESRSAAILAAWPEGPPKVIAG